MRPKLSGSRVARALGVVALSLMVASMGLTTVSGAALAHTQNVQPTNANQIVTENDLSDPDADDLFSTASSSANGTKTIVRNNTNINNNDPNVFDCTITETGQVECTRHQTVKKS